MKVAILGGTFDPPHIGHLELARAARKQLELDEVMLMPARKNPLKSKIAQSSPTHRFEMAKRLAQGHEWLSVSDLEIRRPGPSYAVDTLEQLHQVRPAEYWWLLGADAIREFGSWKKPDRIVRLCRLAVALRRPLAWEDVLAKVPEEYHPYLDRVEMDPVPVSSTEIRDRLETGRAVRQWLDPNVLAYIEQNHLYRG